MTLRESLQEAWRALRSIFLSPLTLGPLLGTVVLLLSGTQGNLAFLSIVFPDWHALEKSSIGHRKVFIEGLPFDQEFIAFGFGFLLFVVIPLLLMRIFFKHRPSDYGLRLPQRESTSVTVFFLAVMLPIGIVGGFMASKNALMQSIYPFPNTFDSWSRFALWESGYLLFFINVEFIFRGWFLFLFEQLVAHFLGRRPSMVESAPAIVLSLIPYCVWHTGTPFPEASSTILWGLITGWYTLKTRSIWPVVFVHWVMNIVLDVSLWKQL